VTDFPDDYPRTTDLLEAILRPDGAARPPDERAELFDRLHRAGCLPVFYAYCRHIDHPIPSATHDRWRTHRTRQTLYRAELAEIAECLDGLPWVVLKSEPLSKLLYGDGRLRYSSDIDLLVRPSNLESAVDRLTGLDYRERNPGAREAWCNNQARLVHAGRGSSLEVHWHIAYPYVPAPASDVLLDRRVELELDGVALPVLDTQSTLLQICYNFHHDQGTLKSLFDVAGWLDRFAGDTELEAIEDRFRKVCARALLDWPCRVLESFATAPAVFETTDTRPAVDCWTAETVRRIRGRYIQLRDAALENLRRNYKPLRTLTHATRRSLSLLLFSDWAEHPSRLLRPLILGRHRIGRCIADALDLPADPVAAFDEDRVPKGAD